MSFTVLPGLTLTRETMGHKWKSLKKILYIASMTPMCGCTYADQQSRDGRAVLIMDHGQQAGQVTLSGSRETQPAGRHVTQPIRSQNKAASEHDGTGRAEGLTWRR